MNRREFIRTSARTAAAVAALGTISRAEVTPAPRKVIIVGAGLAGLVTAYELDKQNFDVTVLEAQERVGGRVFTLRNFGGGVHADAGAARIPTEHDLTHRYIREFQLRLIPFYPVEDRFLRLNNGRAEAVGWDKYKEAMGIAGFLDDPQRWQKIQGGNDQLPKAFAKKLGSRIQYGAVVNRIDAKADAVEVKFTQGGKLNSIAGDQLVFAIPATMLAKIDTGTTLSPAKMEGIRSIRYESASRIFLETRQRFWRSQKLNGFAAGPDHSEIWDSTFGQDGTHGIIQSYLRGGNSILLRQKTEAERVAHTADRLSIFFPELKANMIGGQSKCWDEDPWTLGAWAHPGEKIASLVRTPEGRIFFAGEHLSNMPSWMQGAISSGLNVVKEINSSKVPTSATV